MATLTTKQEECINGLMEEIKDALFEDLQLVDEEQAQLAIDRIKAKIGHLRAIDYVQE